MAHDANLFDKEGHILRQATDTVQQGETELENILKDLKAVVVKIRKQGKDPEALGRLELILGKARDREFLIMQKLDYLETTNQKLLTFDVSLFPDLKAMFNPLSGQQRVIFRDYVTREHAKIYERYDVDHFIILARTYGSEFQAALEDAISSINSTDPKRAEKSVKRAILIERRLRDIVERILAWEEKLLRITKAKSHIFERFT